MDQETQTCPFCATEMPAAAIVCPSCNAEKGHRMRNGMQTPMQIRLYALRSFAIGGGAGAFFLFSSMAIPWLAWSILIASSAIFVGLFIYADSAPKWYR